MANTIGKEAFLELTRELQECLDTEAAAKARRIEIEAEISGHFEGETPEDGSKTIEYAGVRLVIKREINYTADIGPMRDTCPGIARGIIRVKEELNKAELRKLMDTDPAAFALVSPFITSKPAKPYVRFAPAKGGN